MISRCQEAIKLLEDQKLTGRFIPRISQKVMESEKRALENSKSAYQSPLRKAVVVRFNFTIPMSKRWPNNKALDQLSLRTMLHKVTSILGVAEPEQLSPVPQECRNQLEARSTSEMVLHAPSAPDFRRVPSKLRTSTTSMQTVPVTCQICEIRSARQLSDGQTQTVDKSTCEVSTQVSIEDLTKSCTTFIPRGILKTNVSPVKSFSHLTPAQLLAQMCTEKKEEFNLPGLKKDTFPAYGRSYAESTNPKPNNNPYSDNFKGSETTSNTGGKFSGNKPGNQYNPDRFGGNNKPNVSLGYNSLGRSGQFGSLSTNTSLNQRGFDNYSNQGRSFPASSPSSNLGVWNNSGLGRGSLNQSLISNLRAFGTQNKFFNQRGPN